MIECNTGFVLEGCDRIFCQSNSTWTQPGRCVLSTIYFNYQCLQSSLIESSNQSAIGLVPRKQDLVFYSLFDQETGASHLKMNSVVWNNWDSQLVDTIEGPFSIPKSSYSTKGASQYLGYYSMDPKVNLSSFSLTFYLRVCGTETIGLYLDRHDDNSPNYSSRFSLVAVGLDLEFHTHNSSATMESNYYNSPAPKQTISQATFSNVLKPNQWTFVGLVYDSTSQTLKLYDETANEKQRLTNIEIDEVPTQSSRIGLGLRFGDYKFFSPQSAMACFSLHDVVLSPMDIALLPCACQFKDKHQNN